MKRLILIIFISLEYSLSYCQNGSGIRIELDVLEPYTGKEWICETVSPMGTTLQFSRSYEIIHNGKFIKSHLDCVELNIQTDGYYYFDSDKKEIAFLERLAGFRGLSGLYGFVGLNELLGYSDS